MRWLPFFNRNKTPVSLPTIPDIKKFPLASNQYYPSEQKKTHIFLHHTAGGTAAGAIAGWAQTPEHIATAYVIDRNGDIFECFNPSYWAYHLGVKGATSLEKASIGIEIVSYGNLTKSAKGEYVAYTGRIIPPTEVELHDFRGFRYYHKYTNEQVAALKLLLPHLLDRFHIQAQSNRVDFWEYQNPKSLAPGIWSHTTVRKDKVDIFPQKNLIDLVYSI